MVEMWVRDRDDPRNTQKKPFFRRVTRYGRNFMVGETVLELFPVGLMAEAIDREPKTLVKWEKLGLFPKPVYEIEGNLHFGNRWYSAAQLANANTLFYRGFGGLKRLHVAGYKKGNTNGDRMFCFLKVLSLVMRSRTALTEQEIEGMVRHEQEDQQARANQ
jgi:hypothetical protein